MAIFTKPIVLILGAGGQVGQALLRHLNTHQETVHVRLGVRNLAQLGALKRQGHDAVLLDLDDPRTFASALHQVNRVFRLTGYTVAMLAQSKTFVDAARRARVEHMVHLGTFGNRDCTDPHIAWHQLVETYIEASGMAWTHLHANMFMEQIPKFMKIRNGFFSVFWGRGRMGWIAARDIGAVAATVLLEGPTRHSAQHYWLSSEAAGGEELAAICSDVFERPIRCDYQSPEAFATTMARTGDYSVESWYAAGAQEFLRQFANGQMGDFGVVRDDAPSLTGVDSVSLRQWILDNQSQLYDTGNN